MQQNSAGPLFAVFMIIYLVVIVFYVVAYWRIFTKAGQPGWAAIIPVYNAYVLLKISGKPGWWLFLYLIPLVNLIFLVLAAIGLAKNFGRSETFGVVMLLLFGFVGYPMLGYGSSKYTPVVTPQVTAVNPPQPEPAPVQQ